MSNAKSNKTPISKKKVAEQESFTYTDFYANRLQVPEQLKKEMTEKGLEWRYINLNEYKNNAGHKSYWQPYKPTSEFTDSLFGTEDGFFRRGDLILAARPVKMGNAHRDHVQRKNLKYQQFNQQKAEELRQHLAAGGVDTSVVDGYED